MRRDRIPRTFVVQGEFGPVLGHGMPADAGILSEDILASRPTSPEHHAFILDRFPRLAVLNGVTRENAPTMMRLAANRALKMQTAWDKFSQSEDAEHVQ